jgi:hypothetical protein
MGRWWSEFPTDVRAPWLQTYSYRPSLKVRILDTTEMSQAATASRLLLECTFR